MEEEKKNVKEEKRRLTDEEMENVVGGHRRPLGSNPSTLDDIPQDDEIKFPTFY